MNKQPFYGRIDLLVTLAGVPITDEMAHEIRNAVYLVIASHLCQSGLGGINDVVSVEVEDFDGEWGDPSDLM